MPRVLEDHRGGAGAVFRRHWLALVQEFGPPARGSLIALEMGRAALALVRAESAGRLWLDVEHQRATGKGRRPSAGLLARVQKRAALEESSATSLLDRLRAMVRRADDSAAFTSRVRGNGQAPRVEDR
jgi:hypothetical protein